MNILLINTNPVVSRLISLCIRKEETVLEEVTDVSAVKLDTYDIVFVDDASYVETARRYMENLMSDKKVFLSGKNVPEVSVSDFDEVILKPFLPSQISTVLEDVEASFLEEAEEKKTSFIFPLSQEEHTDDMTQTEEHTEEENGEISQDSAVLDGNEIERIKALLEEDENDEEVLQIEDEDMYEARKVEVITEHLEADGLEIISEDEIVNILSAKPEKKKTNKKKAKKAKKSQKMEKSEKKRSKKASKEETYTFEEALIAAIEGMKPKKIKKLLKDAEVTIKINFKDKK